MNTSTSTLYQPAFDRPISSHIQGPMSSNNDRLKTSNPLIFPSLHPLSNLSNFYREKPKSVPKPVPQIAQPEASNPMKKVKLNDHSEKVVVEAKPIVAPVKEEKRSDEFRVPKLPSRFYKNNEKQAIVSEQKQVEAVNLSFGAEPLIIPDCVPRELQVSQKQKQMSGSTPGRLLGKNDSSSYRNQVPVRIPVAQKPMKMNAYNQELLLRLAAHAQSVDQRSIYDKVDFISNQLRQSMPCLFQIVQQNQTKLSQNMRSPQQNGQVRNNGSRIQC